MGSAGIYVIGESRIRRSVMSGMRAGKDGVLLLEEDAFSRRIFFPVLAAKEKGHRWGRIHMDYELAEGMSCVVWGLAAEEKEGMAGFSPDAPVEERAAVFARAGRRLGVNCRDLLLCDLCGRYLWIYVEVSGTGSGRLTSIRVDGTGNRFLHTFPEIYQEEGGFFHRYLSVFSTLYHDLQCEIDSAARWLDADTAPAVLLRRYAAWLGLELEGVYPEDSLLRSLVKYAGELGRMKGTRTALSELVRIVLSEKAVIVERGLLQARPGSEEEAMYDRLYGDSIWDVTILIGSHVSEKQRELFLFLQKQCKPIRTRLHLVCYGESNRLDSHCYMDRGARLGTIPQARMVADTDRGRAGSPGMDQGAVMG